jgi:hypothetical protein
VNVSYDELADVLDLLGADEWEASDGDTLICPHGHMIEVDGECPEGCVSPLREHGVV